MPAIIAVCIGSALAYKHAVLIPKLRAHLQDGLRDASSAQFRNERYIGPWLGEGGMLCGEVNGENLLGAYVGFKKFVVLDEAPPLVSLDEPRPLCDLYLDGGPVKWWWFTG